MYVDRRAGVLWRIDHGVLRCERFDVSAIDPEVAGQLAADLPRDDFVLIIRTFEEDLGRLAQQLDTAAAGGDLDGYRRAAHSLAGAAAAVGARRLEAVARMAMDPNRTEEPRTLAAGVRTEAQQALAELAALADNPPGG